jgi:hypothetical protein
VQEEASVPGTAVGESAPELPTQRGSETEAQQALFELPEQTAHGEADGAPDEAAQNPEAEGASGASEEPDKSASTSTSPTAPLLGARERAVLDFERRPWKRAGAKDEAIRTEFGISPTSYFQILNALLDDPAALAYNPTLVGRLRRRREARQQARG